MKTLGVFFPLSLSLFRLSESLIKRYDLYSEPTPAAKSGGYLRWLQLGDHSNDCGLELNVGTIMSAQGVYRAITDTNQWKSIYYTLFYFWFNIWNVMCKRYINDIVQKGILSKNFALSRNS